MKNIAGFIILCCTALSAQQPAQLAITLDGNIDKEEWKNAATYKMQQDGEVRIMTDSLFVYVAVAGKGNGWSHVYTKHGATVEVLHASAALGASRYIAGANNMWKATQSFTWELRDTGMTENAVKSRLAYLHKNGWVATINLMHPTDQEYVISRSLFDSPSMRIAVARAVDSNSPHRWPGTLQDGTVVKELVFGTTVEILSFKPEQWAEIQ